MSIQSELPVLPLEHHSCQDALGSYVNCRCTAHATSSDQYYSDPVANYKVPEHDYHKRTFDKGDFVEHVNDISLMSMPRVAAGHLRQQQHRHQQRRLEYEFTSVASRASPAETASFECQAMLDSEASNSPASSVSPGSVAQVPSPVELGVHHMPNFDVLNNHHHHHNRNPPPHHHSRYHHQQQPTSHKTLEFEEMRMQQQFNDMLTQPGGNNHHHHHHAQLHRGPKRRAADNADAPNTGNRKERRRTQSINTAFAELRECIPNVPADTKLSKIKTLRLATSYIAYLTEMVSRDDNMNGGMDAMSGVIEGIGNGVNMSPILKADFSLAPRCIIKDAIKHEAARNDCEVKRKRNRTGWPEHVWALELQH